MTDSLLSVIANDELSKVYAQRAELASAIAKEYPFLVRHNTSKPAAFACLAIAKAYVVDHRFDCGDIEKSSVNDFLNPAFPSLYQHYPLP